MASKKLSSDTSLANSYKLSRGVASVARPSAPTIGTATDTGAGAISVTFTASTLGPAASSYTLVSSSGITGSGTSSPLALSEAVVGTYTYTIYATNGNGNGPSSAASNSVNVTSVFVPAGSYEQIATVAVPSGGIATVSFVGIPQTYTHLQMRGFIQTNRVTYGRDWIYYRLNGDAGANYSWHHLSGDGANAQAGADANAVAGLMVETGTTSGGTFGATVLDILDYATTSKYKTAKALGGGDHNGTVAGFGATVELVSSSWRSTDAVSSILFYPSNGTLITQYSHFALYGIRSN
jgi:hypothetical protein